MLEPQPIAQLTAGTKVDSVYVIATLSEATKRDGEPYWRLKIQDKTGTIEARVWTPATVGVDAPEVPGAFQVRGTAVEFRGELQLNVDAIVVADLPDDVIADLVPASRWRSGDMLNAIRAHVSEEVRSEELRTLLLRILEMPEIADEFAVRPAATAMHHEYRSGLVEHALSMMRLGTLIGRHYESYYPGHVETDLIIAGALLHDLGKIWELSGGLATEYTHEGRLLGHIFMAAEFVGCVADESEGVSRQLVVELQHLILSHHGQYEYGAPRLPKTTEAQILHYIDQLDAKTNQFVTENQRNKEMYYHRGLRRWSVPPTAWERPWSDSAPVPVTKDGPGAGSSAPPSVPGGIEVPSAVRASRADAHTTAPESAQGASPKAQESIDEEARRNNLSLFDGLDGDEW